MLTLAKLLLAYLLGSLSGSLLLGRLRGVDIRTQGSGNAGGTNALRTQGWRFALGVAAIDVGKGALAAWLGLALWPAASALPTPVQALACVFAAALGHIYPALFGFRGGKGAATLIGGVAVLLPVALAPLLALWLLVLLSTGYVGLATICAGLALPLAALLAPAPLRNAFALFGVAAALLLLWTHRGNLARLRAGREHRFERARVLPRLLKRSG
ncbi:MAG: glycerol-3-phosphate 1-O-acyltransferase PlsY [Mizugakiibacter sp.]|uniref:glycerol-3-phosphate 1-O-acyltransferase PlsY n=1 Tax=Mizugakiibacter sp. TaxID=1972610 RepID=UPI0031BE4C1D|nr:glycerol-3-phosphate 1-O-acyltransferase PlsY [Xanthomonadaceae bacterium]